MSDVNAFGSSVDPLLEMYTEQSNTMFISQLDGAVLTDYKINNPISYVGMIKPRIGSTYGAKGFEASADNPFGRKLAVVRQTVREVPQFKTEQTVDGGGDAKQPGSNANLLKVTEVIYHRTVTITEVMGQGTIPDDVATYDFSLKKNAGDSIPAGIVIEPLIQGGTPPNDIKISIALGATWDYMKQTDLRDFATWGLVFTSHAEGASPWTSHLITPSSLWTNFIAQKYTDAFTVYEYMIIGQEDDYWSQTLTMHEFRSDNDD